MVLMPRARSNRSSSSKGSLSRVQVCSLSTDSEPSAAAPAVATAANGDSKVVHRPVKDVVVVGAGVAGRWDLAAISVSRNRSSRLQAGVIVAVEPQV